MYAAVCKSCVLSTYNYKSGNILLEFNPISGIISSFPFSIPNYIISSKCLSSLPVGKNLNINVIRSKMSIYGLFSFKNSCSKNSFQ